MLIPIVFEGYVNGYGIIRALADHKIRSILIDRKGSRPAAAVSKYVKKVYYFHDPETEKSEFLKEMIQLGKKIYPDKGILFPTHDEYVITLWKNQKKLSAFFEFPMSGWKTIGQLINKQKLYELCDSYGIACPKTKEIATYHEYVKVRGSFRFPIIVKPSLWDTELVTALGQKTLIFKEKKKADQSIKRVYGQLCRPAKLIVQEYIEGDITHMPDITVFCDKGGKVKSWTAAIKMRQFPPRTGTATMTSILTPDLEMCQITYAMTKKLVEGAGFYGICDAEYIYDARDGNYKLLEINTRFHMQNYMICSSGVDMAYYIYCEHQNLDFRYHKVPEKLVSWCKPIEDKYYAVHYNTKNDKDYGMTKKQWKSSVPEDAIGIMDNYKDIRVFIRYASGAYRRILADKIRALFRIPKTVPTKQFFIQKLRGYRAG